MFGRWMPWKKKGWEVAKLAAGEGGTEEEEMESCGEHTPSRSVFMDGDPQLQRQKWGMATNENQKDKKKTTKPALFVKRITMLPTKTMAAAAALTKEC